MFEFFHNFLYDMDTFLFTIFLLIGATIGVYAMYQINRY